MFLQLKKVSKIYFKGKKPVKEALHDISFDLQHGEVFGLLGVNGAGKTTLSSILATLHPPTGGDILWKEKSVYKNLIEFRKKIGFCPQNPNIDKTLSLEETLRFSAKAYGLTKKDAEREKDRMIDEFDLSAYAKTTVEVLSGGYRQRFLIARALIHRPELVILDEPTVGLDPHIRRQIWEVIAKLRKENITVLLTTHYLDEVEYLADRVCLIHNGHMRTIDTPSNLKKKHVKGNLEDVFLQFIEEENKL